MSYLQGKTPISYLQELCTKKGFSPQYDLIANEGAVHEPTFVFKVTGGEFVGTGKGPSKKKAKHNAALNLLNQMMGSENESAALDEFSDMAELPEGEAGLGNPVGELQELTQKRLWPPPIYDFSNENGPAHAREFICIVKLLGRQIEGTGKSKKIAKRNAATNMIQALRQEGGMVQNDQMKPELIDENCIPLPTDAMNAYTALKEGKPIASLTPQASQEIANFYTNMKTSPGPNLGNLHSRVLNDPAKNDYIAILKDIAKEQRFEITFVYINELSQMEKHQSLVQLSTMPVAVCHGLGDTMEDAHAAAAHNALQYLRIMTKK